MSLVLILASLAFMATIGAFAVWVLRRQRDRLSPAIPGEALQADAEGVIVVPILSANISGGGLFGGMSNNSLSPKLALTPEGLNFKVLRQDHWTFAQLTRVDAGKSLLGATLDFKIAGASLTVTVRDLATARRVLAALPATVPLSERAARLRDGASA